MTCRKPTWSPRLLHLPLQRRRATTNLFPRTYRAIPAPQLKSHPRSLHRLHCPADDTTRLSRAVMRPPSRLPWLFSTFMIWLIWAKSTEFGEGNNMRLIGGEVSTGQRSSRGTPRLGSKAYASAYNVATCASALGLDCRTLYPARPRSVARSRMT